MKKYLYSLALLGAVIYSCSTQTKTSTSDAASTVATAAKAEHIRKGEEVFSQRCGRCHDLPSPSSFTSSEWKPIMERMAPKAKLTAEETNWVLAYVDANAKK